MICVLLSTGLTKFSFSQLEAATDKFSSQNEIGHGGFGIVFKVHPSYALFVTLVLVIFITIPTSFINGYANPNLQLIST